MTLRGYEVRIIRWESRVEQAVDLIFGRFDIRVPKGVTFWVMGIMVSPIRCSHLLCSALRLISRY